MILILAPAGTGIPTVVFHQQGEQLTGTVKENAIEFGFEGEAGAQKIKVSYQGTAVYAGFDEKATWSAAKK